MVYATVADWNNDGASDFWLQKPSGDMEELFSFVPEAITTVSNGIGITTSVTYDRLNQNLTETPPLYQKCAAAGVYACAEAVYPTQALDGPIYVVSAISSSNGIGGTYNSTYAYQGAQADLHGRGFLGFGQVTVTDPQTGVVQTTNYNLAFPLTGVIASQTKVAGGVTLTSATNTYNGLSLGVGTDGVNRYFVELQKTVVVSKDLNGSGFPTATTTYTYDCDSGSACQGTSPTGFGNATQVVVTLSDGSSKTTNSTYVNDTSHGHWYLARLTAASVESIVGTSDLTRQTSYTYYTGTVGSTGLLTSEIVEPESSSDPTLNLETDYVYDAFGNKTSASAKGCVWSGASCTTQTRTTGTLFDTTTYNGQFPTTVTNSLGQSETWAYVGNIAFGGPTSHTGPNGLTTTWQYDTFGRKILEVRPDTNQTTIVYNYCTTTACSVPIGLTAAQLPTNVQFYVYARPLNAAGGRNGPYSVTYYDGLSRNPPVKAVLSGSERG
jgi:YD repeat-containing protein